MQDTGPVRRSRRCCWRLKTLSSKAASTRLRKRLRWCVKLSANLRRSMAIMRFVTLSVALVLPLHAAVIGTSKPVESLTAARINSTLPAGQRKAWLDYLHRSEAQMVADKAALAAEREGMTEIPPLPKQGFSGRAIPLHRAPEFYKSAEARHIGDTILSFQIASGGWSKNLAMDAPRLRGQLYATANLAPTPEQEGDFDKPLDP